MTTLGKYVGGGLTFGAFGGSTRFMERFDPRRGDAFGHAGTFNNNVLTMAAAITGFTEVLTEEVSEKLNSDGNRLRERLNAALSSRNIAGQVTGYGSMMMLHLSDAELRGPADSGRIDKRTRALFHLGMIARGVYLSRSSMMTLSLPMGETEFDMLVGAFEDWLDDDGKLFAKG